MSDNPTPGDDLVERIKAAILNADPANSVWRGQLYDSILSALRTRNEAARSSATEVERLRAERDEADRRAGAAERENARLKDAAASRAQWLSRAKRDAGYDDNVSFDVVWADALAALQSKDTPSHGG